jgi:hypothetical protein
MDIALAMPQDEPQLRALLRSEPVPGWVRLAYEREPDFFHAAAIQGVGQVIVARQNGEVIGMGCRSWREMFCNGQPAQLGYLSGLRMRESARNSAALARGYSCFQQLHRDSRVPGYISTVIESNNHALELLTSGRAGLPAYHDLGCFITFVLPFGGKRPRNRLKNEVKIEAATERNFAEVIQFLNDQGRHKQFFPVLHEADFVSQSLWRGLKPEHFLVARISDGSIAGAVGCWDQSAFKQTRVAGYAPAVGWSRWLCNGALRLAGLPRLPEPGRTLKLLNLALIGIRDARADTFAVLLEAVRERWQAGNFDCICCGFHKHDPLLAAMKNRTTLRYSSRMFWVCWEDGADFFRSLDLNRVPHLEVAVL